jgi:hypothetical protein
MRALRARPAGVADGVAALLEVTDLTVELRARDRILAVAGREARPGALSRLLGVPSVEVRPGGLVGAVVAEATRLG